MVATRPNDPVGDPAEYSTAIPPYRGSAFGPALTMSVGAFELGMRVETQGLLIRLIQMPCIRLYEWPERIRPNIVRNLERWKRRNTQCP
jgi:hypothetical protein